mmetsp:Transcript_6929/g.15789  ORF Transcript_6929/g.15789 Transcript_6929/m.15789 type:complete len:224 (-) Transcript_6929:625-1296(-)
MTLQGCAHWIHDSLARCALLPKGRTGCGEVHRVLEGLDLVLRLRHGRFSLHDSVLSLPQFTLQTPPHVLVFGDTLLQSSLGLRECLVGRLLAVPLQARVLLPECPSRLLARGERAVSALGEALALGLVSCALHQRDLVSLLFDAVRGTRTRACGRWRPLQNTVHARLGRAQTHFVDTQRLHFLLNVCLTIVQPMPQIVYGSLCSTHRFFELSLGVHKRGLLLF